MDHSKIEHRRELFQGKNNGGIAYQHKLGRGKMRFHIDIQNTSTATGHRKNVNTVAHNTCFWRAQTQQKRIPSFLQGTHGLAYDDGLGATATNPASDMAIMLNNGLRTRLGGGWALTPDNGCKDKRLTGLRQLVGQIKQGLRHQCL